MSSGNVFLSHLVRTMLPYMMLQSCACGMSPVLSDPAGNVVYKMNVIYDFNKNLFNIRIIVKLGICKKI